MMHELKLEVAMYPNVVSGAKKFEVRKNDRDFKPGDSLKLMCWDPAVKQYTGPYTLAKVNYVLKGGQYGIEEGYVAMSIDVIAHFLN